MNEAFHVGAIGLRTQQRALDIVAGNITNASTPAFKRMAIRYADVASGVADVQVVPADLAAWSRPVSGVTIEAAAMLNEAGDLDRTGQAMDIAIEGTGFIELLGPGGTNLLWRGGALGVNDDGLLATASGLPLRAAITVPDDATALSIAPDGVVTAVIGTGAERVEIGTIRLVKLNDGAAVERLDGGLYRPDETLRAVEGEPGDDGFGRLVQGAIERSNVAMTDEMVRMMLVQRAFAASAQIVQAADQMMAIANGLRK